jgi:hypothetical protein
MAQYRWHLVENVTFETRRVSLVYRHAHYRSCLAQCLARKCHIWVKLCIVTLIIAHVSLNFMARKSLMSRHDFRGTPTNVYDRTYISYCMFAILILKSIRFLATITMKRRLHSCRIVNMQKYVGAVRHRGLPLRVAPIWIFDVFPQFGESSNIYWFVHFIKNASCWLNCIF